MARNERSPVEWLVASLNRKTTAAATSIEMQTRPVYGSKQKLILAGLEPAIFGSEDQRLIYWPQDPACPETGGSP